MPPITARNSSRRSGSASSRAHATSSPSTVRSLKLRTCSPSLPETGEQRERQWHETVPPAVACLVVTTE